MVTAKRGASRCARRRLGVRLADAAGERQHPGRDQPQAPVLRVALDGGGRSRSRARRARRRARGPAPPAAAATTPTAARRPGGASVLERSAHVAGRDGAAARGDLGRDEPWRQRRGEGGERCGGGQRVRHATRATGAAGARRARTVPRARRARPPRRPGGSTTSRPGRRAARRSRRRAATPPRVARARRPSGRRGLPRARPTARAASSSTPPSSPSSANVCRAERVGVADRVRQRAVLGPPGLVGPGAAAGERPSAN